MAHVSRLLIIRHLRAEPNQHVLHYRRGKLVRSGPGLAYWFHPLTAAVAQVPTEDVQTTFLLSERSADFQEVVVQLTLTYRVAEPEVAAQRINFGISLDTGAWVEQPLQRLDSLWALWSRHPVRTTIIARPIDEVVRTGADEVRNAVEGSLRENAEIAGMGLSLVSVQVDRVAPSAEVEKALQTPTREEIQQKADEATFHRRALAVEHERAIKENELATEIELARRQEELIRQQGANELLVIQQDAERQKLGVEGEVERGEIAARGQAQEMRIRSKAQAEARERMLTVEGEAEAQRVAVWKEAPPAVALGFAAQEFADKIETIGHLNLTPDLLGDTLQRLLLEGKTSAE